MLIITDAAALDRALASPINDTVKRILILRGDLIELATFIVPEPGDTIATIEEAANLASINTFEWVLDHGGAFEAPYILSDDGSGILLIAPDHEGIDLLLLATMRDHAQPATSLGVLEQSAGASVCP